MSEDDPLRNCPHCSTPMQQREDLNTTYWECPECAHTEDDDGDDDEG